MRRMKKFPTLAIAHGQLGVYRVVAELIARGHAPYLPVVDAGIDILLSTGIRLQVKATQRQSVHWRTEGFWGFTLRRSQRIVKRQYVPCAARKFSEEVDFVILHAIEAKRFWVVPAAVLDGRQTLLFGDDTRQWRDCDIEEAKRLLGSGQTQAEVAAHFGMSPKTLRRKLGGEFLVAKRNYANMHLYENKWELLDARQAEAVQFPRIVEGNGIGS